MPAAAIVDQICQYLGGPYDPATHTYHTPTFTVPGAVVGAVRRGRPKRLDKAEFYRGQAGATVGVWMFIDLTPGEESRIALGGSTSGMKQVNHDVGIHILFSSTASYAEDVEDAMRNTRDALVTRLHADRTCGSGGIEVAGGFMVGEGGPPWIRWLDSDVVTTHEGSKATCLMQFAAIEVIFA